MFCFGRDVQNASYVGRLSCSQMACYSKSSPLIEAPCASHFSRHFVEGVNQVFHHPKIDTTNFPFFLRN